MYLCVSHNKYGWRGGLNKTSKSCHVHSSSSSPRPRLRFQSHNTFNLFMREMCQMVRILMTEVKMLTWQIKEKEKKNDGPPFLDVESLTSRSMQILLVSCAFTAWGHSPLFHLVGDKSLAVFLCVCALQPILSLIKLPIVSWSCWKISTFLEQLIYAIRLVTGLILCLHCFLTDTFIAVLFLISRH